MTRHDDDYDDDDGDNNIDIDQVYLPPNYIEKVMIINIVLWLMC